MKNTLNHRRLHVLGLGPLFIQELTQIVDVMCEMKQPSDLEVCHLRCVEQMAIKGVSFRQNTTMYLNYCIFYYCIQVTSFF